MLLRTKKFLIVFFAALLFAVAAALGASLLAHEKQTARAATVPAEPYWVSVTYPDSGSGTVSSWSYATFDEAWRKATGFGEGAAVTVTLGAAAETDATLNVDGKNIKINLKGNTLALKSGASGSVVKVSGSGSFTLADTAGGGVLTGGSASEGGGVYVAQNATFTMDGGTISGNTATNQTSYGGGGVYVDEGAFVMNGGTIKGNTANNLGGGVYLNLAAMEMTEGAIVSGNTAKKGGGGIYAYGGTVTMTGGAITGNTTAEKGGGGVDGSATLNISGKVTITDNRKGTGEGMRNSNVGTGADINVAGVISGSKIGVSIGETKMSIRFATGAFEVIDAIVPKEIFISDEEYDCIYVLKGNATVKSSIRLGVHQFSEYNGECYRCYDAQAAASVKTGTVTAYYDTFQEAWTAATAADAADVKMFTDAQSTSTLNVNEGNAVTLDLNGYKLEHTGATGSAISVNGAFTLADTYEGGYRKHSVPNLFTEDKNDTVTITGGVITGGKGNGASNVGGGIFVDKNAALTMTGGTVAGNTAGFGGGIRVDENATFTMTGGAVSYNRAEKDGGGLCVCNADGVELNGGQIAYNSSHAGGGVYFEAGGKDQDGNIVKEVIYKLGGADITNNQVNTASGITYSGRGGGVYLDACVLTMSGGKISNNAASGHGGGVFADGAFTMSGGAVTGNECGSLGGGVYLNGGSTFSVSGAVKLIGNKAIYVNISYQEVVKDDNLFIHNGESKTVTVGKLEADGEQAQIGIGAYNATSAVLTSGYGANNRNGDKIIAPDTYFVSDYVNYPCVYAGGGEVRLGAHTGGAATCKKEAECTNCGKSYGEKAAHTPQANDDCTVDTLCSVCGAVTTAKNLKHDFEGSLSYCTDGEGHWKKCKNCAVGDTANKSVHTPGEDPHDCTEDISCTVCGKVTREKQGSHLWSTGYEHNETHHWLTCIREGCGAAAPQIPHDALGSVATCTQGTGCATCGAKYGATDPDNHSLGVLQAEEAATCTETGKIAHRDCTLCGKHFNGSGAEVTDLTIVALGHGWNDGEITAEPTCTKQGVKTYTCTRNSAHTETEPVEINPNAHSWDDGEITTPATCEREGEKTFTCKHNDAHTRTEQVAVDPDVHSFAEAWSKDGMGHWHAAVCTHTSQKSGFAAHTAGEWIVDASAQIGVAGSKHKECTVCGHTAETAAIPALIDELRKENKVIVTASNGFSPQIELVVTEIEKESYGAYEGIAQTVDGEINLVYDVTLKSDGVTVQPDGTLTIKLLIPADLRGKNFKLFHLHEAQAADIEYTVEGDYAVVSTDRLSEFIFVGEKPAASDGFNPLWLILIVVVALVIAGEAGYIIYRKARKNKAAEGKK